MTETSSNTAAPVCPTCNNNAKMQYNRNAALVNGEYVSVFYCTSCDRRTAFQYDPKYETMPKRVVLPTQSVPGEVTKEVNYVQRRLL